MTRAKPVAQRSGEDDRAKNPAGHLPEGALGLETPGARPPRAARGGSPKAHARSTHPEALVFFQLYHPTDPRVVESFLRRAERAGCAGVVLTVDTVQLGWRPRDLDLGHLPFLRGQGLAQYLTDPAFMAALDEPGEGPGLRGRPSLALLQSLLILHRVGVRLGVRGFRRLQNAVRRFVATYSYPELSWEEVRHLRQATALPLILKGILHPEDARKALEPGVDGIYVSNHGGRQVDGALAALEALPGVVKAVEDRVPVLMDSGVRTGADVIKALALGAKAVGLGRPYVYLTEMELTLVLSGIGGLEEIGPEVLVGGQG